MKQFAEADFFLLLWEGSGRDARRLAAFQEGANLVLQMEYCEAFRWLHGCFAIPRRAYRRLSAAST